MRDAAEQLHRRQRHRVDPDRRRVEQPGRDDPVQQADRRGQTRAEHEREPVAVHRVEPARVDPPARARRRGRRPAGGADTRSSTGTASTLARRHDRVAAPGAAGRCRVLRAATPRQHRWQHRRACPDVRPLRSPSASTPSSTPSPPACSSAAPGDPRPRAPRWPSTTPRPARRWSRSPTPAPTDGRAALDAAVAAQAGFAAMPPARARGDPAPRLRADDRPGRRPRPADDPGDGQAGRRVARARSPTPRSSSAGSPRRPCASTGGTRSAPNGASRFLVMRQPVGACLLITPWNFPAAMGTRKIGPAVAAGCTMVLKPAQQTPLSMHALAAILAEAGLPDGVLNIVTTGDAGGVMEPLIRDGRGPQAVVHRLDRVGRKLLEQAADQVLRTSMELGGNAPFLVFADADLDAAVERRHDGQDAQHGRGVHRGQPLPRPPVRRRRLRRQAHRADGGAARSGAAPRRACRWARWSTRRAGTRSSSSSATRSTAARRSASAARRSTGPG